MAQQQWLFRVRCILKQALAKLQCAFTSVTYSTVASRVVIWIWTIVHKAEGADP